MRITTRVLAAMVVGVSLFAGTASAEQAAATPGDPLPPGCVMRLGSDRFRHGIPVSMLAVSVDEKLAVAVNGNHMLGATRAFDLATGRVLFSLGGWEGTSIEAAAVSPDGQTVVTKQDFSLRVRDAATGAEVRKIELPRTDQSYSRNEWVLFTPDGKSIAVTSQGTVIHLIDFENGNIIREFSNRGEDDGEKVEGFTEVLSAAFSPDGKLLAAGGFSNVKDDYFARLWDVETGKELRRFQHGRSYGIAAMAFSADGTTLATGAHDARLRLFDVASGKNLKTFPKNGKRRMVGGCVALSPDGKTVATAGQSLRVYDVASGAERWHLDRKALGLVFTDGGKTLTGAVWGAIYRWDAATGKPLTPQSGGSIVEQIIASQDGSRIVTRGQSGDAHVWDGVSGKYLRYVNAAWQRGLAMSPDGRFLVWPAEDESVKFTDPQEPNRTHTGTRIRVYDIAAGKFIERFEAFKGDAHELTFIDGGQKLVTVDHRDGGVRVWDFEAGKEERTFRAARDGEMSNSVWRSALSPDGKTLAVSYVLRGGGRGFGNETYPLRVWDVGTERELLQLDASGGYVFNIAFSPDSRLLVSSAGYNAGPKGELVVWDMTTSGKATTLPTSACAVAFSGDGRHLATASPDGAIRLWETATWNMSKEFSGHRERPTALAFSLNRPLLFSGSLDTSVLAWDIGR